MKNRGNLFLGIILVVIGVLFLMRNFGIAGFQVLNIGYIISRFWPFIFLMIPGLAFHFAYFSGNRRDAGILVPGGILLIIGITLQLSSSFGIWHLIWPGYILAVAVGLFELYLFGNHDKGLLIPVIILAALSLFFFASMSFRWYFGIDLRRLLVPSILIAVGLLIVFKRPSDGDKTGQDVD
jgi:hypothetical protein